ncbi:pyridoxal-phosphate dependent enzyme [Variovorax sp. PCZ-1]|uniref:pyridoxal-phosphate dependent enzyme n=1 Tax=Variovorax sp. PCZ-1 TaxID=2835533 RepID=UPI0020BD7E89|nr:pyridoxal-phosphate dependent enzyme [Variovorax sp. PCZ-1]
MSAVLGHADLHSRPVRLIAGWRCLRCNTAYEAHRTNPIGCVSCLAQGIHASLRADYSATPSMRVLQAYDRPFSLGEGNTPCTPSPSLARTTDVVQLWIKDESCNPTGSHKDRMSAIGITQALEMGAHTVVLASSGNAALSAARYAQAAGLRCEVAAYDGLPRAYAKLLDEYGAVCHSFADNEGRWAFVRERAQQLGYLALTNYSLPALGSAPLAIEGYKLIAQECIDNAVSPTDVVVPTARGDLAWGIFAGFRELLHAGRIAVLPRIWIVEPFARLSKVLAGAELHATYSGQTAQFSTAGATVTYLQYQAATASLGGAVVVNDAAAHSARDELLALGISAELCAAAAYSAITTLRKEERISASSRVLWLLTANASRDPSFPT